MASWLSEKEAPAGFTIDRECELKQPDSEKATVRYARHTLDIDEVGEHIRQDPAFEEAYTRIRDLVLFLLPRYEAQGKAYVHVAFGCTGGRHRSVMIAENVLSDPAPTT